MNKKNPIYEEEKGILLDFNCLLQFTEPEFYISTDLCFHPCSVPVRSRINM